MRPITTLPAWRRRHPAAHAIAAAVLASPELLNLRTRRLVADIRDRFHVGGCTARIAVALARRSA